MITLCRELQALKTLSYSTFPGSASQNQDNKNNTQATSPNTVIQNTVSFLASLQTPCLSVTHTQPCAHYENTKLAEATSVKLIDLKTVHRHTYTHAYTHMPVHMTKSTGGTH